jgi:hypothetical protein
MVTVLVGIEPIAVVVFLQSLVESEEVLGETIEF